MTKQNLLYRRQFLLGPEPIFSEKNWNSLRLNSDFYLSTHPDLEVTSAQHNNRSIILIGYILDPYHSDWDNHNILINLIKLSSNLNDFFDQISIMGGRYVIIANFFNQLSIFNDPAGYRQIYYCFDDKGRLWCASQPGRISEILGIQEDYELTKSLYSIDLFKNTSEFWLPGSMTIYKKIYHLTPNHYINPNNKNIYRFWPNAKFQTPPIDTIVRETSKLMQGIIESAANRFDIAFTVTAGADTRVALAASKKFVKNFHFFTHTHPRIHENGPEITIPKKILNEYGLEHHVAHFKGDMNNEFLSYFLKNTQLPRKMKGANAYTIHQYFNQIDKEMLVCNGEIGGIAKRFYRLPYFFPLNGKILSILTEMPGSKYIEESFELWLESAKSAHDFGIQILDLLYLEGRMANWSAMTTSEYDIAFESLSPFNCRKIIQNILSAPKQYRKAGAYHFHISLIKYMWPDLLNHPINPTKGSIGRFIKALKYSNLNVMRKALKLSYKYLTN